MPNKHGRKQAQAKMRMKVKKLVKKYDYSPNKSEKAWKMSWSRLHFNVQLDYNKYELNELKIK